jgi:hypothetical protein
MSVNSYLPHVLVLPEDDANREIANGFLLEHRLNSRKIQVLTVFGGWGKVVIGFNETLCATLETYPERRVILLFDFDDCIDNRIREVNDQIPSEVKNRVYILGVASTPEKLQAACDKKREEIGNALAKECAEGQSTFWQHPMLSHNKAELSRLLIDVKPFLFK